MTSSAKRGTLRPFSLVLALTACSRAPELGLAVCAGGQPIDASAVHSMSIHANGHVRIDGVGFAEGRDAEAALKSLMTSMHTNEAVADKSGFLYAVDEPFVVRIDRATPFITAAYWLWQVRTHCHMYVTWLAVLDERSGDERCLRLERPPPRQEGDIAFNPDWASELNQHDVRVEFSLGASNKPVWSRDPARAPRWHLAQWTSRGEYFEFDFDSWSEVHDKLVATPDEDRYFAVGASIATTTRWSEVAPIVAEAVTLWDARVYFGCDEEEL